MIIHCHLIISLMFINIISFKHLEIPKIIYSIIYWLIIASINNH